MPRLVYDASNIIGSLMTVSADNSTYDDFTRTRRSRQRSPELQLCFGILFDAVRTVAKAAKRATAPGARRYYKHSPQELARKWIADTNSKDIFSFNTIWSVLYPNWNVNDARRELLDNPVLVYERMLGTNAPR